MFGKLILKLDRLAVRPVDFTIRIKEIADTMPEGYAEGQEEFQKLAALAGDIHASIEDINDRLWSVRQTEALKEVAKDTNLALHEIFKYLMQNYVKFDWNDRMLVPHQRYVDNIMLLDRADRELTEGNRAGVISALETVDYNYYASYFSRETCRYFVLQVTENTADTWGKGMVENGNQDLYDTLRLLEAEGGMMDTDVIRKNISDARKMQTSYLETALEKEREQLPELSGLMKQAQICLSELGKLAAI